MLGREVLRLAGFVTKNDRGTGRVPFYGFHFCFRENADSPLAKSLFQLHGNFLVFQGHRVRKHFEDGYFRAEGPKNGGEFNAHRAGAYHHKSFGDLRQLQDVAIADNHFTVEVDAGQGARLRAGGKKDMGGFDVCGFSGILHLHMVRRRPAAPALQDLNLVLAEKELDALGMFIDDALLARQHGGPVDLEIRDLDAKFIGVLQSVVKFRVVEQDLGGDAAYVQAGAAQEPVLFDDQSL